MSQLRKQPTEIRIVFIKSEDDIIFVFGKFRLKIWKNRLELSAKTETVDHGSRVL